MTKIFYAGHLRPFKHVGHHPQFEHIQYPPPGYQFVTDAQVGARMPIRLLTSISALCRKATANGSNLIDIAKFIRSRSIRAQLSLPADVRLAFLPSMPFILGQIPWVIEIEDTTTLFAPFPRISGRRHDPRIFGTEGIYDSGFFPIVKALLQSNSCRGVICHVRSTAESIPVLFNDDKLSRKIVHIPLGIRPRQRAKVADKQDLTTILFTNSWHQAATGFYLRGGLDLLEAYSAIYSEHPRLRLILRTKLPDNLDQRYRRIIERCNVQVIDQFLSGEEIEALFSSADIYVLPSARLHVVSILQAMAYGLAIVVSDGWGIEEYVNDGRNGLIVRGRYGTCSWMDSNGMLRENYKRLFSTDAAFSRSLTAVLSSAIEDAHLRAKLGNAAIKDVETKFSVERWNFGLANAFDKALSAC
jgi:glycosyltransferase involved in cell wall biosynthesis